MDAVNRNSVAAVQRQFYGHTGASGRSVFGSDGPAISLDQGFGNRQPQPKAASGTGSGRIPSVESLKYVRQILRADADTVVLKDNLRRTTILTCYSYLNHPAFRAVANGVFQQVEPH